MLHKLIPTLLLPLAALALSSQAKEALSNDLATVPAPLYADPVFHGSCDPEITWNAATKEWWIFYTARRCSLDTPGDQNFHTPIGVAASKDWIHWRHVGYCSFDGVGGEPYSEITFWAPAVIRDGDTYHMFVTYIPGARIVHYEANVNNLLDWKKVNDGVVAMNNVIDPCLLKVDNHWVMVYLAVKGGIHSASSDDLIHWKDNGPLKGDINDPQKRGYGYQEAPYLFRWKDRYWLMTDPHKGLAIFSSSDFKTWTLQGRILEKPGTRPEDNTMSRHCSVAVVDDRAFVFYHVEPLRNYRIQRKKNPKQNMITFLQMAEFKFEDGKLTCDRNLPIAPPPLEELAKSGSLK
jgi:predicted GH43/DUF377 family glycosyl hydrolase